MAHDSTREVRRHFGSSPEAIGEARRFLVNTVGGRVPEVATEDLVLTVSELATNAVVHARTEFDVVIGLDGRVSLEVEDGSTELPVRQLVPRMATGGRGLQIVDALCDRWGVRLLGDGKCVWCERDLPSHYP